MNALRPCFLLLLLPALLTACGQKGPLYLPGSPSEIRSAIPPADAEREAEADESDDEDEPPR